MSFGERGTCSGAPSEPSKRSTIAKIGCVVAEGAFAVVVVPPVDIVEPGPVGVDVGLVGRTPRFRCVGGSCSRSKSCNLAVREGDTDLLMSSALALAELALGLLRVSWKLAVGLCLHAEANHTDVWRSLRERS